MNKSIKKFDINCILAIIMRISRSIFILLLLLFVSVDAIKSQTLNIQFDYCQFTSSDNISYLETYLSVDGNSTIFKEKEKGKFQSEIEVEFVFTNSNNKILIPGIPLPILHIFFSENSGFK